MQTITMTELRTKPKELLKTLKEGNSVDLIHRSRVVAEIKPKIYDPKPFNPEEFMKIVKKLNLKPLSDREIEKRYRKAMVRKHGKAIFGY